MRNGFGFALLAAILAVSSVESLPMHDVADYTMDESQAPLGEGKLAAKGAAEEFAGIADQAARSKQSSLNNEQQLRQVTSDAADESETAKAIEAKMANAESLAHHKLQAQKALLHEKASKDLLASIKQKKVMKKVEAIAQAVKSNTLTDQIQAHQDKLDRLKIDVTKMSAAKEKAQREALEHKLHALKVRKGVEDARLKNRQGTLSTLHHSYTITQSQTSENKEKALALEVKAKRLAGELEVLKKTGKEQEAHLQKVEKAATLNTEVQGQAMDQIKDRFAKETAALDEKIYAMKQSLAMKQVHLKELQGEATEAHTEATKATANLNRLSFSVKGVAAKNKQMTEDYERKTAAAKAKVDELVQEFAKVHATTLITDSKLQLAKKRFKAVSAVHSVAHRKAKLATAAGETVLKATKKKIEALRQAKATEDTEVHRAEVEVFTLVKEVATDKINLAPEKKKAVALDRMLSETEKENTAATGKMEKWLNQSEILSKKVSTFRGQVQHLEDTLPQATGESKAVKASVETKTREKAAAKAGTMDAVEAHKEAAAKFASVAAKVVETQSRKETTDADIEKTEDDVSELKAGTQMEKTESTNKLTQAQQQLKDSAEAAEKDEGASHVLGTAYAALIAQVAAVKKAISDSHIGALRKERDQDAHSEREKSEVGQVAITFEKAKGRLLHAKHNLALFLNESAAETQNLVARNADEETETSTNLQEEVRKGDLAQAHLGSVKAKVSAHMEATIIREKRMQDLRAAGIQKMTTYASTVMGRLNAIMSSDEQQNAELKDELNQLETEIANAQQRDLVEQKAEQAGEDTIAALKTKELDTEHETREAIATNTEEILTVQGGKVDASITQEQAELVNDKLEVAHLAASIKETSGRKDNATAAVNSADSQIHGLLRSRSSVARNLEKTSDDIQSEHAALADESSQSKELQRELETLEAEGARKKKKLAMVVAEYGVDTEKVKEMAVEIVENTRSIKDLKSKLGLDQTRVAGDEKTLDELQNAYYAESSTLSEEKEQDASAQDKAKLIMMKLQNALDSGGKSEAEGAAIQAHLKALREQLAAADAETATDLAEKAKNDALMASMSKDEKEAHLKAMAAKAKQQRAQDIVAEEEAKLSEAKGEAAEAARLTADEKAEASQIAADIAAWKTVSQAQLDKLNRAEKAIDSGDGKNGEELKKALQAAMATIQSDGEKLSHEKALLKANEFQLTEAQRQIQLKQANGESLSASEQKQLEELNKLLAEADDRKAALSGTVSALSAKDSKMQGEQKALATAAATDASDAEREKALKMSDKSDLENAQATLAQDNAKIASDLAKEGQEEGEVAKTKAVNEALTESVAKEGAVLNQTVAEETRVRAEEDAAAIKKSNLKQGLASGQEKLSALKREAAAEDGQLKGTEADLLAARAKISGEMRAAKLDVKSQQDAVRQGSAVLNGANAKAQIEAAKEAQLKAETAGKAELLKTVGMNLEQLKTSLAQAEDKLKSAQAATIESRAKVESTKVQAGQVTRKTAQQKADLLLLEQAKNLAKAEGEAVVAGIKSHIADAEEKQQQAKQRMADLTTKMQVMAEENTDSKTSTDNTHAEVFTKEKQLATLKKAEAVLKAFLAGPLLSVDGKEGGDASSVEVEEEEEAQPSLMESSDLPADLPPL